MKHLTGGLLDYASAGAPAPRLQVVETSELLEAALADLRAEIDAAGAAVTTGALPRAACDPVAVRQVLQNLLANAVKHRAPGRPCRVAVSAERTPEGAWAFSVADNGRGVPPEDRERVFAMFATLREGSARTPSDRERGHGIGLATCQRLVARGGGRIWLEGTPGGGTTARFTLAPARA